MAGGLTGKVVLVTGATDGLGRGVAIDVAQRGATVLVHGRNRARGEAVLAEIKAAGGPDARLYLADFGVLADIRRMADAILASEPRLTCWSTMPGSSRTSAGRALMAMSSPFRSTI